MSVYDENWRVNTDSSAPKICLDLPNEKWSILSPMHYWDMQNECATEESLQRMHLAAAAPVMYRAIKMIKVGLMSDAEIDQILAKAEGRK